MSSLKDTARIDCLNELGFEYSNPYWNKSHYVQTDTALIYSGQAQKEAIQLNYSSGIGKAFQNFGMAEEQRGNYNKSEQYTRQAISILNKTGKQAEYYRAVVNLGWCAFNQGRYKEALYDYKTVLPYYEHIEDTTHIAMIYRMTGNGYAHLGYSDSAFYFFQKNSSIKKTADDINGIINSNEFKGTVYLVAGDTAKAISFYLMSADSARAKNAVTNHNYPSMFLIYKLKHEYDSALLYFQHDIYFTRSTSNDSSLMKKNLMFAYKDIAELYLMMNNYDKTISYGREPLKAFRDGNAVNELMTILKYLAMAYEMKHDDATALKYANQLLAYSKKSEAKAGLRDGYMILWKIYDRSHQLHLAYKYHLKYTALNDSIQNADYKAKIAAWDAITKITEEDENYNAQLKLTGEKKQCQACLAE